MEWKVDIIDDNPMIFCHKCDFYKSVDDFLDNLSGGCSNCRPARRRDDLRTRQHGMAHCDDLLMVQRAQRQHETHGGEIWSVTSSMRILLIYLKRNAAFVNIQMFRSAMKAVLATDLTMDVF